jgi:uncharacterized protein YodC (DUF2158 family)
VTNPRLNVGDKVTLRTGGPVMTVQAVSMSLAYCAWSTGGRLHHGTFETDSLELSDGPAHGALRSEPDSDAGQPAP